MHTPQGSKSLLEYLRTVPDPRRRQGRRYPLAGLLAFLILAALHGKNSLHGMWRWAQVHQRPLLRPLDLWATGRLPTLTTLWNLLQRLDVRALERAVHAWMDDWGMEEAWHRERKSPWKIEDTELPALQTITAIAQQVEWVIRQRGIEGNTLTAALRVLTEPLPESQSER
ncbi:MAG: hypothetical protein DDG58_03975 [Ardenticatenia bacterium]|jgi:hypothetical protein|nr:MAG: hypothetical protein DDG58_03975 [Ardenticatenia bacterium]